MRQPVAEQDLVGCLVGASSARRSARNGGNGWEPAVMDLVVANCLRPALDCQMNLLGDGTMLAGVAP